MKKTRILAALICVMMVVCSLPMMQASAALTGADFNTIGALIGKASAVPVENHASWFGMNFDFKDNFSQTAGITLPTGCSYDNTNGLNFEAGAVKTWSYFPSGSSQWSPLVLGAYTVRFKLDQGGFLGFQACELYGHDRSMIEFSNTGVTVYEGNGAGGFQVATAVNAFTPGTDWIDMVVAPSGSGYAVYTKKATDKNFTHVATAADYRPGGNWKGTGMTIYGQGAHVSDAEMLMGTDTVSPSTNAYSNEVNYTVSGSGTAIVKNGNHLLQMTHSTSGVSYVTASGAKTYGYGTGTFKVLTDGPFAEVYRNGQFAFSYLMPKASGTVTAFNGSITNGSVTVPAERKSWYAARNVNVQNAVYELADLPHNHNLDFVASPADEVHLALNDGYYRNDITLKDGKIYVLSAERNNSVAKSTEIATMASGDVYYRVETSAGMSRLYADGKFITTFRNGNVAGRKGTLAVNVTGGDGLSYLGVNSNADLYYYSDTFDGSGEFASADYWSSDDLTISATDGSMVLDASNSTDAMVLFNAACGDFDLSATVTIDSFKTFSEGGFWFLMNHPTSDAYTKAGYYKNAWGTTKQYQIIDNASTSAKTSTATGSLSTGTAYQFDVKVRQNDDGTETITLYVDGSQVLTQTGSYTHRGKIGFILSKCKAIISDVSYRGDAKPMLDVRDNPLSGTTTLDMIETDSITYLVNAGGGFTTTDGGKTWTAFTPSAGAGLSTEYSIGMTQNMVQLQNGEVLSINKNSPASWRDEYDQRRSVHNVWVSTDNGMNWSKRGNIGGQTLEDAIQGRDATVNRISQGPSGRIYFVAGEGNSEDYGDAVVWYSDDNGSSWTRSSSNISAINEGYVIAEAVVIETTKDTRFYFRTDKGQLCYYLSNDRGATWDMIPHSTPFVSSMTCFGVEADPADPDTLYLAWGYDNINLFARAQFPRTRWAVAKSTDGGDTWEMIGTAHENNSVSHNMMNLDISVGNEYIYLNAFSSDTFGETLPWTSRIVSFPKSKQRTSVRMEQLHLMYPEQIENTTILPKEKENLAMVVSPASGGVLLNGQWIPGAASGEYVSVDVLATFVGATTETAADGTVSIKAGNSVVTFGSDILNAVNGTQFVKLEKAAEQLGLIITEEDGTQIVSTNAEWSARQKKALRFATDLF